MSIEISLYTPQNTNSKPPRNLPDTVYTASYNYQGTNGDTWEANMDFEAGWQERGSNMIACGKSNYLNDSSLFEPDTSPNLTTPSEFLSELKKLTEVGSGSGKI